VVGGLEWVGSMEHSELAI